MKNISITRWLQRNKDKATPSQPIRGLENLNVLVVDDSRTQLHVMEKMLNAVGINTMTAENGRQAILVARHKKTDIIQK